MRLLILSFLFTTLFYINQVLAQTYAASWDYPFVDGMHINYIDTIVLQWTSNYKTAWLNMWCQNGSAIGNNVIRESQFQVLPSGAFPYIMFTEAPLQASFPVACHAQLAADEPNGNGVDSPFGITFTSDGKLAAKTFSSSASSSSSSIPSSSKSAASISATTSSISSTSTQSGTATSSSSVSAIPSNTSLSLPPLGVHSPAGGLSSVAKAGIAVGAVIVTLIIIGSVAHIFWRKRRTKPSGRSYIAELDDKEAPGAVRFGRFELEDEARRRHELPLTIAAHEMEHKAWKSHELPGSIAVHEIGPRKSMRYELPG